MNISVLRKAIANMFPDQYSFWTWRKLLPDFVDMHLQAMTIRWQRYRHQRETDPAAVEPRMPVVLDIAVVELAKQQKLSYAYLALSHYQQLHRFGALTAENSHLRQQLAEREALINSSLQLSDRVITVLENNENPDRRQN